MDSKLQELIEELRKHASKLNALSEPLPGATVFYEVMSGGLVWSDEKIEGVPVEVIWALRPLWAFRSSLIAEAPQEKWRSYWDICRTIFPSWVGFRPERSTPSPELLKILQRGQRRLDVCLKKAE